MSVPVSLWQARGHHVGVANRLHLTTISSLEKSICYILLVRFGFYLVHIVVVDDAVEALVDVVQHVHHLHGRAVLAQSGEAHDVAEINGHLVVQLWLHHTALL